MGPRIERSTIVIARFPFSDLTGSIDRPTLVMANAGLGDWILGQITTNPFIDELAIELTDDSLSAGSLNEVSYFRPNKLFTSSEDLIIRPVARLKPDVFNQSLDAVVNLLNQNRMRQ